jgi:GLPGLI family protein
MKNITIICLMLLQSFAFGQKTFQGILEYEVTVRIDVERIRMNSSNPDAVAYIPDVFNYTEKLHVNGNYAKQERVISFGGFGGFGGSRTNPNAQQQQNRFRRMIPETFWDFTNKKVATVMSVPRDSVNMDKYVIESDVKANPDIKEDKKTKKILGYNCKKATLKTADDTYTIWYTTELGFTYSPMSQSGSAMMRMGGGGGRGANNNVPQMPAIVIDNAVILAVEGTDIGFEVKKIDKVDVALESVKIPEDAKKVTQEEFTEIMKQRRGNYQRMMGGSRN